MTTFDDIRRAWTTRYYPVVDRVPGLQSATLPSSGVNPSNTIVAKRTGEFRAPRKGEWFSGAIPEAYRAPNDLTTMFHIARLVRIERIEVIREVELL